MQLRKLANSFAHLCLLCSLSVSLMSFTDGKTTISGDPKKADSVSLSKTSKSLLPNFPITDLAISIPLNPLVTPFVTTFLSKQSNSYEKMKVWGKSYFDLYDRILTENNVPVQMKYLSVIESELKPSQVSCAGAMGPWQLMSSVAKGYGLKTGGRSDDRKDFTKSTKAAAKMLNSLYNSLGDWLLVIAAYNAGEGRVRQAMKQAHSDNFWTIQKYLPQETRNHVKKFIATHFFFEGCGGVTTMTAEEVKNSKLVPVTTVMVEKNKNLRSVEIQGRYNSTIMAKYLQMDIANLNSINPGLSEALNKGNVFSLNLPADKVELFNQQKPQILRESVQLLMVSTPVAVK